MKKKNKVLTVVVCCLCVIIAISYCCWNKKEEFVHRIKLEINAYKEANVETLKALDIPFVVISTEGGVEPNYTIDPTPPDGWGKGIKDADYVNMRINMFLHDSLMLCYGVDKRNEIDGSAKIRIRGNTSAIEDKKPYKLRFANKVNLLGGAKKECLLLRIYDIKPPVGFETNKLLGLPYAPSYQFVNVVVNNNYRGLYLLTEPVSRGKNRVDISKEGFLIEADPYYWQEETSFKSSMVDEHLGFTFKYPKPKKLADDDIKYIRNYIGLLDNSVREGRYEDYIDLRSWTLWLLLHDILGTLDAGGSNIYISKYDRLDTTKLQMPTAWDFDRIMLTEGKWSVIHDNYFYFHHLIKNSNPAFWDKYLDTYRNLSPRYFQDIDHFLEKIAKGAFGNSLDTSLQLDAIRWDYSYKPLHVLVGEAREWFASRQRWMESRLKDKANHNRESTLDVIENAK